MHHFARLRRSTGCAAREVPSNRHPALGANWPLACAGLAALRKRADRSERADLVVAQFEKLYPWPIYFALAYLLAVEPRPPVGDPAAGAKDWWGDNLIVPGLFRDYFAERERLGFIWDDTRCRGP